MPSFKYNVVRALLKILPFKKMLSAPPEKLMKAARKLNSGRGRGFQIPRDASFEYEDVEVSAASIPWHCLVIRDLEANKAPLKASERSQKALLYIFGGGMISEPDKSDILPALKLARETTREVWFPFYPLCLDYSAMVSLEMVVGCYKKMLETFAPEDICVLGYSSGACLALGLSHFIREREPKLPQPAKLILLSPGSVTSDKAWTTRAKALEKKDILVGYSFLDSAKTIMQHGEPLPDWFLNPWSGSFEGFPHCDFWFGSDELFAASVPNFKEACQNSGVSFTMTVGEKMCHCYPFIPGPNFPEKLEALKKIAQQIRES